MANNMTTSIVIEGNEELMNYLKERKEAVDSGDDCYLSFVGSFYDNMENDRSWFIDNVGAKWCYHEDFWVESDTSEITLVSAWYTPIDLLVKLYELCSKVDSECNIYGTYEDESYSPIGGFVVDKNGFNSEEEGVEYPNEDDFIGEDGEIDYDLYESAVEDFHNNLWEIKERLKQEAISNSNLVETEN
jgi:hypothetical protein